MRVPSDTYDLDHMLPYVRIMHYGLFLLAIQY